MGCNTSSQNSKTSSEPLILKVKQKQNSRQFACKKIIRIQSISLNFSSQPHKSSGVMQHSDNRLTMDSLNVSKMTWSTITSPTPVMAFRNSFKLLMHDTGNNVEKFLKRFAPPNPLEKNLNPSQMHPNQTTSPAKTLCLNRRTTQALPMAKLPNPRNPLPIFHQSSAKMVN